MNYHRGDKVRLTADLNVRLDNTSPYPLRKGMEFTFIEYIDDTECNVQIDPYTTITIEIDLITPASGQFNKHPEA